MQRLAHDAPPNGTIRVHHGMGHFWQEVQEGSPASRFRFRAGDSLRRPNEVWINMGAGGIGDTLLGLCAVKGYKTAHPEKFVVYRFHDHALRYVMMFDGYDGIAPQQHDGTVNDFPPDRENDPADARDMQLNAGYQLELRGKAQIDRLQRYCRNLGCIEPVMPVLREPAKLTENVKYRDLIVLCPFSSTADRAYPMHGWLTIEKSLREAGYDTVVIGTKRGPLVLGGAIQIEDGQYTEERVTPRTDLFRSDVVTDPTPEMLAGIILTSRCVIGNDSGPAHIAGIMGRPTIVLCGWSIGDKIFGAYPQAVCLQGSLACNGCWTKAREYDDQRCNRACANLGSIDPQTIVREVMARVPMSRR